MSIEIWVEDIDMDRGRDKSKNMVRSDGKSEVRVGVGVDDTERGRLKG